MLRGRKIWIENGTHRIVVKNPVLKSDRKLKTVKVHDGVELVLPGTCIVFGVPMRVEKVTVK